MNFKANDLAEDIGFRSRVTEISGKKRKLSLDMIYKINKEMQISTEILVQEYK